MSIQSIQKNIVGRWQTTGGQGINGGETVIQFNDHGKVTEWGHLVNQGKTLFADPDATSGNVLYAIDGTAKPPVLRISYSTEYSTKNNVSGRDLIVYEWKISSLETDRITFIPIVKNVDGKPFAIIRVKQMTKP